MVPQSQQPEKPEVVIKRAIGILESRLNLAKPEDRSKLQEALTMLEKQQAHPETTKAVDLLFSTARTIEAGLNEDDLYADKLLKTTSLSLGDMWEHLDEKGDFDHSLLDADGLRAEELEISPLTYRISQLLSKLHSNHAELVQSRLFEYLASGEGFKILMSALALQGYPIKEDFYLQLFTVYRSYLDKQIEKERSGPSDEEWTAALEKATQKLPELLGALEKSVELIRDNELKASEADLLEESSLADSEPEPSLEEDLSKPVAVLDSLSALLKDLPAAAKPFAEDFILYVAELPEGPWPALWLDRARYTAADLVVSTGYDATDIISKMLAENSSRTTFALGLIDSIAERTKTPDLEKIESQLCQVLSVLNSSDRRDEILGAALRSSYFFQTRPLKLYTAFRQHLSVDPKSASEAQEALLVQLARWAPDEEVPAIEELCFEFFEHARVEFKSMKIGRLELAYPPLVHFAPLTDRSIRSHKRFEQLLTDKSFKQRKIAYGSFYSLPLAVAEEFLHRIVTKESKASLVRQAVSALPTIYANDCVRGLAQLERFSTGPLKVKIAKIREAIAEAREGLQDLAKWHRGL